MRALFRLFPLLLTLAACGFHPIYGAYESASGPVAEALNSIAIDTIADRNGQMLRNHLIDRMYSKGRPTAPAMTLNVTLSSQQVDLGIQKDATTTRRQLTMTAVYILRDKEGKILISGKAQSIVSSSKLDAQYATLAAETDANNRAVNEVGEQIVNRLALYLASPPTESPTSATE